MKKCPYITNIKKLCDIEDCKICYEKSFASHEKVKYWSKENKILPRKVFKSSHTKYMFNCDCNHIFEAALNKISVNTWCPYCASRKLCDNESCIKCYEKSFASHEKSKFWSNENTILPRKVFKSSGTKYMFNCECGHIFEAALYNINKNTWCPYCSNKKLCDDESCIKCYEKSFASHEKSKYWSEINNIKPRCIFKKSIRKYSFNCPNCNNIYKTSLYNINPFEVGIGCQHNFPI